METSEQLNELFGALAKAQAKMGAAKKGSANPFFKSKYADLAEVRKTAMVIHEFGLSISQFPCGENGLTTVLAHESGQWISNTMTMKPIKNDPQGLGSCITYMRRYAMQAVLGIPSEDDDGNQASKPNGDVGLTDQQKKVILKLIRENDPDATKAFGVPSNWTEEQWKEAANVARKYRSK